MSAEGDFTIGIWVPEISDIILFGEDIHSETDFAFEELSFLINETQKSDFCLECLSSSDYQSLESVNLCTSGR